MLRAYLVKALEVGKISSARYGLLHEEPKELSLQRARVRAELDVTKLVGLLLEEQRLHGRVAE